MQRNAHFGCAIQTPASLGMWIESGENVGGGEEKLVPLWNRPWYIPLRNIGVPQSEVERALVH
jgi:hypothetical protein